MIHSNGDLTMRTDITDIRTARRPMVVGHITPAEPRRTVFAVGTNTDATTARLTMEIRRAREAMGRYRDHSTEIAYLRAVDAWQEHTQERWSGDGTPPEAA